MISKRKSWLLLQKNNSFVFTLYKSQLIIYLKRSINYGSRNHVLSRTQETITGRVPLLQYLVLATGTLAPQGCVE